MVPVLVYVREYRALFQWENRESVLYSTGPRYFQICRSQFQILGAMTWNRFHSEDLQFWSELWSSLLRGTFCWMHVNRSIYLCGWGKTAVLELNIFDVTERNLVAPVTGISTLTRLAAWRVDVLCPSVQWQRWGMEDRCVLTYVRKTRSYEVGFILRGGFSLERRLVRISTGTPVS